VRAAVLVLLDPPPGGLDALGAATAAHVSRDELKAASDSSGRLTPRELDSGEQHAAYRAELLRAIPVCGFLAALLGVVSFEATSAGRPASTARRLRPTPFDAEDRPPSTPGSRRAAHAIFDRRAGALVSQRSYSDSLAHCGQSTDIARI
jgi:hypothetical protein